MSFSLSHIILANSFKNIQEKIEEIFVMVRKSKINDKKQIEDLTNSVRFMSSKFDEYEREG